MSVANLPINTPPKMPSFCGCLPLGWVSHLRGLLFGTDEMPRKLIAAGTKLGRLTVLRDAENKTGKSASWCRCECGVEKLVKNRLLINGQATSCGCLRAERASQANNKRREDLTGKKFGRWTIVAMLKGQKAKAICECGTESEAWTPNLKHNKSASCGCLSQEINSRPNPAMSVRLTTHGQSKTPIYKVWASMIARCTNATNPAYGNYGGRGILVCERWLMFENFIADMGQRPSDKHSIDRIDNNGNYEPKNCRWATKKEQCNNTRSNRVLVLDGKAKTMTQWAEELGLSRETIRGRLRRGATVERALR